MEDNKLKELVKQKYTEIALKGEENSSSCCCGSVEVYNIMSEDYTKEEGYNADADLGLGCGLPTQFAGIKPGDTVLDLGSGAGNDCFVARAEVGEKGKVIGVDFSEAMLGKAIKNAEKLGYTNVSFRQGDIEDLPIGGNSIDVVISNCVLNLLPRKEKIFHEIFRVLKPSGHFCISDIVLVGELPDSLKEVAEFYAGCVSGAIQKNDYLREIAKAGFEKIEIKKEKTIIIPNEILEKHLEEETKNEFKTNQAGIFSITVTGVKPKKVCDCGDCC